MKTPDKDVVLLSVAEKYFRKTLPALIKVNVYVFVVARALQIEFLCHN